MVDLDGMRHAAEEAIKEAFSVGDPPPDPEMRNDHCPECRETVARFKGKAWPDLAWEDLRGDPALGALTATGFRYYLPAMMRLSLQFTRELDVFPDSLVGALSPKGQTASDRDAERLAFTVGQACAILAFLLFLEAFQKVEDAQSDWPDEAIEALPTARPLARAIRFWRSRAAAPSVG